MLAPQHRLTRRSDFTRTLKSGVRANRRHFVTYIDRPECPPGEAVVGGPRFGLIVGKSVGNAITRHAVSRKLRAAVAENMLALRDPTRDIDPLDEQMMVVLRALPGVADTDTATLTSELAAVLSSDRLPVNQQRR